MYRMPKTNRQNELDEPFFIRSQIIDNQLKDNFIDYNRTTFHHPTLEINDVAAVLPNT